jgi:predicted nuclease with TOPRIM domain
MENTIKLSEEEVTQINQLQTDYATITAQMGQLKIEQILLNVQLDRLKELEIKFTKEYLELQVNEESFAKQITTKYGDGDINLESGEFIPFGTTV